MVEIAIEIDIQSFDSNHFTFDSDPYFSFSRLSSKAVSLPHTTQPSLCLTISYTNFISYFLFFINIYPALTIYKLLIVKEATCAGYLRYPAMITLAPYPL